MAAPAQAWLDRLRAQPRPPRFRIMNVCGGHERTITHAGLRSLMPAGLELIPGPGCPVCVCPEEDIHHAIRLALEEAVILLAFGDMLRVPVNGPKSQPRSLAAARAAGADVRPVASPRDALRIARAEPQRQVVFFAAGFETTMAPVAALILEGLPDNLSILASGRRTWPAVAMLLASGEVHFDALVAPGHVSAVMGPEEWTFVAERHGLPVAVAGFEPESLLAAFTLLLRQHRAGRPRLENAYPEVVRPGGNPAARRCLESAFTVTDANWRGIGTIADSGYALAADFAGHDARHRFPLPAAPDRRRAGEMPPGCDCAGVVLGRLRPDQCRLYGTACQPRHPVGPCMVSDEGACRIWWSGGVRPGKVRAITGLTLKR